MSSPADGQMHTYAPAHSTVFSALDQLLRADAPPHMVHGLKDVTSRREVALGVLNTSAVSATELISPVPAQANILRWAPFLFFCLPSMSSFSAWCLFNKKGIYLEADSISWTFHADTDACQQLLSQAKRKWTTRLQKQLFSGPC